MSILLSFSAESPASCEHSADDFEVWCRQRTTCIAGMREIKRQDCDEPGAAGWERSEAGQAQGDNGPGLQTGQWD